METTLKPNASQTTTNPTVIMSTVAAAAPITPVAPNPPITGTNKTVPRKLPTQRSPGNILKQKFNTSMDLQQDQKRRSSSRSIKRKRFDDEIVEYSIVPQNRNNSDPHRVGRPRTTSQTHHQTSPQAPSTATLLPPAGNIILPTVSNANTSTPTPVTTQPTVDVKAKITLPVEQQKPTTVSTISSVTIAPPQTPSIPQAAAKVNPINVAPPTQAAPVGNFPAERRRPGRTGKRSRRAGRTSNHLATKDLGRWKPVDDLALIIAVQQTNDLRIVHRGVKFSCRFTLQELQARWTSLMYEPTISRLAVAGIRNLHPEMVEMVKSKALYSVQEEELLAQIKSTDNPKMEQFQELLDNNAMVFYPSRTAKALMNHWHAMKQYELLSDQVIKPALADGKPMSFSDAEDLILDGELSESRDEALEIELRLHDRQKKRQIRILETELSRWTVLVDSVTNSNIAPEFDSQTLAILRGRSVRYLMRSKEITFGRTTKDSSVDVDLTLEGPSTKISRRQGTIKLRSNGDFFISNEGKRPVFINGSPLLTGNKSRLSHNCVVEISNLRFIFLVNYELINAIRHESAKTTAPLN